MPCNSEWGFLFQPLAKPAFCIVYEQFIAVLFRWSWFSFLQLWGQETDEMSLDVMGIKKEEENKQCTITPKQAFVRCCRLPDACDHSAYNSAVPWCATGVMKYCSWQGTGCSDISVHIYVCVGVTNLRRSQHRTPDRNWTVNRPDACDEFFNYPSL